MVLLQCPINRQFPSLRLLCIYTISLSQTNVLWKLIQDQMVLPSRIVSKEREGAMSLAGGYTLALHTLSCPPFMQQLARCASHVFGLYETH